MIDFICQLILAAICGAWVMAIWFIYQLSDLFPEPRRSEIRRDFWRGFWGTWFLRQQPKDKP